jgi:hypothetical protein
VEKWCYPIGSSVFSVICFLSRAGCVQEGVDEGLLEDAEPSVDPEGRSYLHVLTVEEVQRILEKTRADDVQVIPVRNLCEWADHLIIASGHSGRHLRGISEAICFEVSSHSLT